MEIIITTDGQGRCVYDEAINLTSLGQVVIERASHVDPEPCDLEPQTVDWDELALRRNTPLVPVLV